MKITKYGHSCLLVEINNTFILTDPGKWNPLPDAESIDAILVTHEHQDHLDLEQLRGLIERHPTVRIITHEAVGKKLEELGIVYELINPGDSLDINKISIESYGTEHAAIYGDLSPCRNTGYLINYELFVPGDALHELPPNKVRILALPCGGPWMRLSEAIDYAKKVRPEIVFPIHDALYVATYNKELIPRIIGGNLKDSGILFIEMGAGSSKEF